jgi:ATP synthase F1 complex assembly factor 2
VSRVPSVSSSFGSKGCYRFAADHPSTLVRLQTEHWDPLHAWYKSHHGVEIKTYDTLVLGGGNRFKQSDETKRVLREAVKDWDAWQIAGTSRPSCHFPFLKLIVA